MKSSRRKGLRARRSNKKISLGVVFMKWMGDIIYIRYKAIRKAKNIQFNILKGPYVISWLLDPKKLTLDQSHSIMKGWKWTHEKAAAIRKTSITIKNLTWLANGFATILTKWGHQYWRGRRQKWTMILQC